MLKSEELINKVKNYNKFLNPETLSKAYDFALSQRKQKEMRVHLILFTQLLLQIY